MKWPGIQNVWRHLLLSKKIKVWQVLYFIVSWLGNNHDYQAISKV